MIFIVDEVIPGIVSLWLERILDVLKYKINERQSWTEARWGHDVLQARWVHELVLPSYQVTCHRAQLNKALLMKRVETFHRCSPFVNQP